MINSTFSDLTERFQVYLSEATKLDEPQDMEGSRSFSGSILRMSISTTELVEDGPGGSHRYRCQTRDADAFAVKASIKTPRSSNSDLA